MKKIKKDRDACVRELGYAWIYMHYLQPDWLDEVDRNHPTRKQKRRIKKLMLKCAVHWHRNDDTWWEHFYNEIIEEIENMC